MQQRSRCEEDHDEAGRLEMKLVVILEPVAQWTRGLLLSCAV